MNRELRACAYGLIVEMERRDADRGTWREQQTREMASYARIYGSSSIEAQTMLLIHRIESEHYAYSVDVVGPT